MDFDYRGVIRTLKLSRKMGQTFLINQEFAKTEANFGLERKVVEMGPGLGILTEELCRTASGVLAIEKDKTIYSILEKRLRSKKLRLLNADFFEVPASTFRGCQIMISNVPYSLSSKVISWLYDNHMPALLCLQREFISHMLAAPGSDDYTRLSVMSSLMFTSTYVLDVPAGNFYPVPRVDSGIIYLRPSGMRIDGRTREVISMIMNHKKKKLRNAIIDSSGVLGLEKSAAAKIADSVADSDQRPFQMSPQRILEVSGSIAKSTTG